MKLFELVAGLTLDAGSFTSGVNSATKAGNSLATSLSGGFSAVSAKTIAMGQALYEFSKKAAQVALDFAKDVVGEYADAEQLIGGVETLFKGSAQTVIDNAKQAYKTAGMSANEYMETVTSFSASLLQGLDGDTKAAARIADMAIQDMSDNANKMGTDMASIQNAYQGFAKDNYTMLDNLKLGYGGTASEMARLINDSGVLGDTIVKASDVAQVPLDKIYEAIHVIQTEMGITGTTAKEASSTISGSVSAFKSAWQNVLAGLGSGENMDAAIDALFETGSNLAENVLALLPRLWDSTLSAIDGVLMQFDVTRSLKHAFDQGGWAAVLDAGTAILDKKFGDFWNDELPGIVKSGANTAISAVNSIFGTNIPMIEDIEFPSWETVKEKASACWQAIKDGFAAFGDLVVGIMTNPAETGASARQKVTDWWNKEVAGENGFLVTVMAAFGGVSSDAEFTKTTVGAWWNGMSETIGNIVTFGATFAGVDEELSEDAGTSVQTWWNTVGAGISGICKIVASFGTPDETDTARAIEDYATWWATDLLPSIADLAVVTVKVMFDVSADAIAALTKTIYNTAVTLLYDALEAIGLGWMVKGRDFDQEAEVEAKTAAAAAEEAEAQGYTNANAFADTADVLLDAMKSYAEDYVSQGGTPSWGNSIYDYVDEEYHSALTAADFEAWNQLLADLSRHGDTLTEEGVSAWFGEDESEDVSSSVDALTSAVEALMTAAGNLGADAAAAAGGALNGAKVEMDGQAVGELVLPTVVAGISRNNRVVAKALAGLE